MSVVKLVSGIFENPEIKSFCGCYCMEDLYLIFDFVINSAVSFVRLNFENIPNFDTIKKALEEAYSGYSAQKSLDSLQDQLKSLKSEVYKLEELASKLQSEHEYSLVNQANRKIHRKNLHNKPSSEWRKGFTSVFRKFSVDFECNNLLADNHKISAKLEDHKELDPKIYPEWWMELCDKSLTDAPRLKKHHRQTSSMSVLGKLKKGKEKKKTVEKSVEVNLSSYHSTSTDNHVRFTENTIDNSKSFYKDQEGLAKVPESSSSSSTSNFFPSNEMKKFYQAEFKRLFGNTLQENYPRK